MKKTIINSFLILGCVPLFGQVTTVGNDRYIGGVPSDSLADDGLSSSYYESDIIGDADVFDLTSWQTSFSGNELTVSITGNYFHDIWNKNNTLNTDLGDLFISTGDLGWSPFPDDSNGFSIESRDDYIGTKTINWEYGIAVSPRDNLGSESVPGSGGTENTDVYSLANATINQTNASGTYRALQEYSFDNGESLGGATWWIDGLVGVANDPNGIGVLNFKFDITDLGLNPDDWSLAFHWTMECGNDVIEWQTSFLDPQGVVPEPSTYAVLGLGTLLSLVYLRRRRAQKKA